MATTASKDAPKKDVVKKDDGVIAKVEPTMSERFTVAVMKEFGAIVGQKISFGPHQKRLAQHLFLKIDASLAAAEKKRAEKGGNQTPIVWANINMAKLATDAVHRVELGLDALIENHISPIPYFNTRMGKYDLDLRIGYSGKDYYMRKAAVEEPVDIIYELVYGNDKFQPIKRTPNHPLESYTFEITDPFNRGEVVGGFGYILFEDTRKNQLVIVTEDDFKKSQAKAAGDTFWKDNPIQMRYKTVVHRTVSKLQVDPEKVNASFLAVEKDDMDAAGAHAEIAENANKGPIVAIEASAKIEDAKPDPAELARENAIDKSKGGPEEPIKKSEAPDAGELFGDGKSRKCPI